MARSATILLLALAVLPIHARGDDPEANFETNIRPVLAGTCFACHGGKKTSGGLRVDSRAALLEGGDRGPAIVPGMPEMSLLIAAIRHDDSDLTMPPGKKLSGSVAADFAAWIKAGAIWPESSTTEAFAAQRHWAFEPVRATEPPPDPNGWSDHPIDRFLSADWRKHGIRPATTLDRRTLIRRLAFDLTGLPPTPLEIDTFLTDESPDAFDRLIDRLLDSPRYGERWGRHWMDVAHYSDTAGDNADYPIPEVYRYRDYIIGAFNHDKPYDEFVREQLAGDLLALNGPPERHAERTIATGFLALSRRYATAPQELWHLTLEDAIETTGRAFLGLTLRCARCHDHKFDPVTRRDYYALYGIFASTQFPYTGSEELHSKGFPRAHLRPLLPPDQAQPKLEAYRHVIESLRAEGRRVATTDPDAILNGKLSSEIDLLARAIADLERIGQDPGPLKDQLGRLQKRRDAANARLHSRLDALGAQLRILERPGLPSDLPGAYAVGEGRPADVAIQIRGEPDQPGPIVARGVPAFLAGREPPVIPPDHSGRLELANWLTRPNHPLTARVMVNRIWQHHFGRGIVATPSNFGLRGTPPTHPELLDWLADRFVASGWSIKAMHRLILSARAYQLSSLADESDIALDSENRWFARFDRRRLSAEEIRDSMLSIAGQLDLDQPGPHPFPPIERWSWTQHNPFKDIYDSNYRSIYLMIQRFQRHPFLALFDGPDANQSTDVRTRANVPLQALYLMNDPFVRDRAEAFARRLIGTTGEPGPRIALAHALAWGRPPTTAESDQAEAYISRYADALQQAGAPADRIEIEAWTSFARIMLTANEALYVD